MSIWQTQSWQDMLIASWQSEEYFVIERDIQNNVSLIEGDAWKAEGAAAEGIKIFVEKRIVSLWEYGLFVIGFEWKIDEDLQDSLQDLCKEEKCLFVQVETIDYVAPFSSGRERIQDRDVKWAKVFKKNNYYKKFIPPYTALIDLTQSEDDILAAMKPKGRYNIKLAKKKGVVVEQVDAHIWNITKFHTIMQETTSRNNFSGNMLEYYKIFLESLENSQMMFAYHEWEVIAAWIFVTDGEVMTYYYGASTNWEKRKLMPTYLLQWAAIEHAKKKWCKIYDFLGVAWDEEKNSSLAWVTDFKMKLSPQKHLVSDAYIFINKTIKYKMIMLLKKVIKK